MLHLLDRGEHSVCEKEAAELLARIVDRMSIDCEEQGPILITVEADDDLVSGLCLWGACTEDLEDDDPVEDDGHS